MLTATCSILLGLYCFLISSRNRPMIGFRGILYYLQTKNSWTITNKVFGLFLLISGIIYLVNSNLKIFVGVIVLGIFTTDIISSVILKKAKTVI